MNAEVAKDRNVIADSTRYQYCYFFENDSSAQQLYVSKGKPGKQKDEPGSLKFKLILKDKFDSHRDIALEGTANIESPNESFTDTASKDGGDYFAADYSYSLRGCILTIRMDVEEFQACVIRSECEQFKRFFKKYPDYDILRRRKVM